MLEASAIIQNNDTIAAHEMRRQGCPTFLPGRIDFMKSPFENVEGRFSLQNLPMEGRKEILPLKSPLENSKGESLFKISLLKRENIFSGEF